MKDKFCITSAASFQSINKAQTNRSTTKKTFSFSKSSRFEQPKPTCPLYSYGGDFIAKKASGTAIGYGTRSDFTKCVTSSPSAGKYDIKTFWDQNMQKKKGSSFALSRDQVSFNCYISKQQIKFPSSTHYNNDKKHRVIAPKYTLRQKTNVLDKSMTIDPQNKNPGPGSYLNPEMQKKNSFKFISKFQNLSYGQSRSKRFQSSETITPGPGKYKDLSSLSKTGKYLLSQNKGGTKAIFDHQARETQFDRVFKRQLSNPGPGYYPTPSQFGQYDGDIYKQIRNGKRSSNGWAHISDKKYKK